MGSGIAIDPVDGVLLAPCDAEVLLVAPTQHSVTLRLTSGAELLIHVGLETVALEGRGFEARVRGGDQVQAGDPLIVFDMDAVGLEAKSLVTPIVLTNAGKVQWSTEALNRLVRAGEAIGWIDGGSVPDAPEPATTGQTVTRETTIRFEHGLHARPAARIADCAKRFVSDVTISLGDKRASARSPVAIMALNARRGDRITLSAMGADAATSVHAVLELLDAGEAVERKPAASVKPRALAQNEIGGVCALPGVVFGTARHWQRAADDVPENGKGLDNERSALAAAKAAVRGRLEAVSRAGAGAASEIALAHLGLLDDEELNAAAEAQIVKGKSAGRAWQFASEAAASVFRTSDNPRLRERVADLDDISRQVVAAIVGDAAAQIELREGTILLADELLPSELMSLPRDRIVGLATEGGGPTSHMAIIAASFGIPTLVAMGARLAAVADGTRVLLDATAGVLVVDPDETARARVAASAEVRDSGVCATKDGHRVQLFANLGGLRDVDGALAVGAEGCGLLRTEFLFLDRPEAPSGEEQREAYQAIADALGSRPLTIRTLDIGGDKPVPYIRFPAEQNPALGARGVRTALFDQNLIDQQLRAIAEVRGAAVKVMLPMVSSVDEFRAVRERLGGLRQGITLGVMVETPAAAVLADTFAAEADFLSIGSNDLAQYTLAMDRTNPLLAAQIDALHPAVLRLIAMTSEAGRRAAKPVSLCGSLASEPIGAVVLVGLGIHDLSGVPAALPAVRQAIARVSAGDCRRMAEQALAMESASEVRALAAELLNGSSEGDER